MLYGCDSNSNDFPCAYDFYIGELNAGGAFNADAARAATPHDTFGYYFLLGPASGGATDPNSAYQWGRQQADGSNAGWQANDLVWRNTIFGDIEGPGENGWTGDQGLNQKVWEGFRDVLGSYGRNVGLYSTNYQWNAIMGSGYQCGVSVVWSADSGNVVGCRACPASFPNLPTIGGVSPTIWQYNLTPGCPSDLDLAVGLPG